METKNVHAQVVPSGVTNHKVFGFEERVEFGWCVRNNSNSRSGAAVGAATGAVGRTGLQCEDNESIATFDRFDGYRKCSIDLIDSTLEKRNKILKTLFWGQSSRPGILSNQNPI